MWPVIAELETRQMNQNLTDEECVVSLAFDSIKIRGSCVYSSVSGEFLGLVDEEQIHVVRMDYESWVKAPSDGKVPLAKDFFVWYATSLGLNDGTHFQLPVARWTTAAARSTNVSAMCISVGSALSSAGYSVAFVTCDGAAENRSFFKQVGILLRNLGLVQADWDLLREVGLDTPEMLDHPIAFRLWGEKDELPCFVVQDMPHVLAQSPTPASSTPNHALISLYLLSSKCAPTVRRTPICLHRSTLSACLASPHAHAWVIPASLFGFLPHSCTDATCKHFW